MHRPSQKDSHRLTRSPAQRNLVVESSSTRAVVEGNRNTNKKMVEEGGTHGWVLLGREDILRGSVHRKDNETSATRDDDRSSSPQKAALAWALHSCKEAGTLRHHHGKASPKGSEKHSLHPPTTCGWHEFTVVTLSLVESRRCFCCRHRLSSSPRACLECTRCGIFIHKRRECIKSAQRPPSLIQRRVKDLASLVARILESYWNAELGHVEASLVHLSKGSSHTTITEYIDDAHPYHKYYRKQIQRATAALRRKRVVEGTHREKKSLTDAVMRKAWLHLERKVASYSHAAAPSTSDGESKGAQTDVLSSANRTESDHQSATSRQGEDHYVPPSVSFLIDRAAHIVAHGGSKVESEMKRNPSVGDHMAFLWPGHPFHAEYCRALNAANMQMEKERKTEREKAFANTLDELMAIKLMSGEGNPTLVQEESIARDIALHATSTSTAAVENHNMEHEEEHKEEHEEEHKEVHEDVSASLADVSALSFLPKSGRRASREGLRLRESIASRGGWMGGKWPVVRKDTFHHREEGERRGRRGRGGGERNVEGEEKTSSSHNSSSSSHNSSPSSHNSSPSSHNSSPSSATLIHRKPHMGTERNGYALIGAALGTQTPTRELMDRMERVVGLCLQYGPEMEKSFVKHARSRDLYSFVYPDDPFHTYYKRLLHRSLSSFQCATRVEDGHQREENDKKKKEREREKMEKMEKETQHPMWREEHERIRRTGSVWLASRGSRALLSKISPGGVPSLWRNVMTTTEGEEDGIKPSRIHLRIAKQCQSRGTTFLDPEFPPNDKSLGAHLIAKKDQYSIVWKRPHEFINSNEEDEVQLFEDGIEPTDIQQGKLGDCWLMASISVLAERPSLVRRLFLNDVNECGVYSIRLFQEGRSKVVTIDDHIPCTSWGGPVCSRNHGAELWVMLLEKAMAKVHGSYSRLQSGTPQEALRDLTGFPARKYSFKDAKSDISSGAFFQQLLAWKQSGYVLAVATGGKTKVQLKGLASDHAYAVLDVLVVEDPTHGEVQLMKLRNPWGHFQWKGDWAIGSPLWTPTMISAAYGKGHCDEAHLEAHDGDDGGVFHMSFQDVLRYFSSVTVCFLETRTERVESPMAWRRVAMSQDAFDLTSVHAVYMCSFAISTTRDTTVEFEVYQTDRRKLGTFIRGTNFQYTDVSMGLVASDGSVISFDGPRAERQTGISEVSLRSGTHYRLVVYSYATRVPSVVMNTREFNMVALSDAPIRVVRQRCGSDELDIVEHCLVQHVIKEGQRRDVNVGDCSLSIYELRHGDAFTCVASRSFAPRESVDRPASLNATFDFTGSSNAVLMGVSGPLMVEICIPPSECEGGVLVGTLTRKEKGSWLCKLQMSFSYTPPKKTMK